MMEHFIVFNNSKLFEFIWDKFSDRLDKTGITFSDIYRNLWNPVITCCKDLLYKVYHKSFTYSDIEPFAADVENVNIQLTALHDAMCQCYSSLVSSLPDSTKWLPQAVKNVTMYLDFAKCAMQANRNTTQVDLVQLCLKLKELLRLKGDFLAVNHLDDQVSICCKVNITTIVVQNYM